MSDKSHRVIISISSDIGHALACDWLDADCLVSGTYRRLSNAVESLPEQNTRLNYCDLQSKSSIVQTAAIIGARQPWDVLVFAAGWLVPVGRFADCSFDIWSQSFKVNFTAQMRMLHELLPSRNPDAPLGPLVLFFAGGGVNSAPPNYSAYTIAKIALIKAVELLDAEMPDCRFAILGPGWVKTKIHEATILAGEAGAGLNYHYTQGRFDRDEFTPMQRVVDCCNWIVNSRREVVSGRNFSVNDNWENLQYGQWLKENHQANRLRRHT